MVASNSLAVSFHGEAVMFLTTLTSLLLVAVWISIAIWSINFFVSHGYGRMLLSIFLMPISLFFVLFVVFSLPEDTPDWLHKSVGFVAMIVATAVCVSPMFITQSKSGMFYGPLPERFKRLGDMTNLLVDDVVKRVGPFNSRSSVPNGFLLQWQYPGYHIAISFDENGRFRAIEHEHSA